METNHKWARGNNHTYCFMPDDIPSLRSYREASIHYEAVKPFSKGQHKGEKPFGRNRKYARLIMRREVGSNDTSDVIVIKHYQTDIAKYHADGRLTFNTGNYESVSTTQILQEIFGVEKFARRKGKVYYFDSSGKAYRVTGGGLRVCADGLVDTDSAYMESKHMLNRTALKEKLKQFAPFLEYACMVTNMTRGGKGESRGYARYTTAEGDKYYSARSAKNALSCDTTLMRYNQRSSGELREAFFNDVLTVMGIADETKRMDAMLPIVEYMGFCASTDYATRYVNNTANSEVEYVWRVDTKRLKFFFTELVKFQYAKEVFIEEPIPLGTIGHDSNKKYLEYGVWDGE